MDESGTEVYKGVNYWIGVFVIGILCILIVINLYYVDKQEIIDKSIQDIFNRNEYNDYISSAFMGAFVTFIVEYSKKGESRKSAFELSILGAGAGLLSQYAAKTVTRITTGGGILLATQE